MSTTLSPDRPLTGFAGTAKQQELARQARAMHESWVETIGPGRVTVDGAGYATGLVTARVEELRTALEEQSISIEEHNDQRFVMVMAMRRLIDTGCEERASRMIAREMHDLFADSPPLPHPKYRFTFDWVTPHAQAWENDLAHLKGKAKCYGLEIGGFEG